MVRKYRSCFLKTVIVRLDFSYPVTKLTKTLPQRLKDIIPPLFPISEPKEFIGKEFVVSKDATKEKILEGTKWFFHGLDRQKTLVVSRDNVNIEYKTYESYDVLKREFIPIVDALLASYDDLQGKRLGLRYINEIVLSEGDLLNWSNYIDGRLLTSLTFPEDPNQICRAFTNLEINHRDFIVRFQYGMFNPDYPASIRRKNFTLDYDAYYQGLQDTEDVKQNLDRFHDALQKEFERSITDELRNKMGVEDNG